jgi:hypothetical protein
VNAGRPKAAANIRKRVSWVRDQNRRKRRAAVK